jgi:hypothetical protein
MQAPRRKLLKEDTMARLDTLAARFRADLLADENRATARMVRAYSAALVRLNRDLAAITRRIEAARSAGQELGVSWLFRQDRLASLKRQAEEQVATFARQAAQDTAERQAAAVAAATEQAPQLVTAALGPGPASAISGVQASFVRLPTAALEELVGRLGDGSPLRALFDTLPALVSERLETLLIAGIAGGLSPRVIAREVADAQALGLNRALLISRTEVLRSYREATHQSYQANSDIVEGWIWTANLGPRTCASCWALHASFHRLDERLDEHPAGRCSAVPWTKSWEALGYFGIEDTRPEMEIGSDVFARQDEGLQRAVLGNAGFEAYRRGEVRLVDFVAQKSDERWGSMRYARSLKAVREGRGGEVLGAEAVPAPPPP